MPPIVYPLPHVTPLFQAAVQPIRTAYVPSLRKAAAQPIAALTLRHARIPVCLSTPVQVLVARSTTTAAGRGGKARKPRHSMWTGSLRESQKHLPFSLVAGERVHTLSPHLVESGGRSAPWSRLPPPSVTTSLQTSRHTDGVTALHQPLAEHWPLGPIRSRRP